jgi:hypothetical protein
MAAVVVDGYNILVPNDVEFQVESDENVVALRGTLRRINGLTITQLKKWNRTQLTNGVSFDAEEGADRYEIVVSATVTKNTRITGTTNCTPPPPTDSARPTKLRISEGLNERLWLFFPTQLPEVEE